ncbi:MAG: HD family hydrolase [Candidatus Aphodomorpha sp.]
MKPEELLRFLQLAERLKSVPRHCYTAEGERESVAAHAWRVALLALLLEKEQPDIDMRRVIELALVHDLGEAVTGDIPSFLKTERDESVESDALSQIVSLLPAPEGERLRSLFQEWEAGSTREARFCRALDKLEAVISHNESDIATWLPLEYTLNQTYGEREAEEFACLKALRTTLRADTRRKIADAEQGDAPATPPEPRKPAAKA